MDTLSDRLAELADDAPTGGAPAAELWARGKRAHRLRAAAVAATLVVVGAVGTGIGVRLADGDGNRSDVAPAGTAGITLPIEYPVGEDLPDLGDTPGPLAAIWLAPRVGGGAPEAVGLVAETGTFGTLPINVSHDDPRVLTTCVVALSPDGRRMAYASPTGETDRPRSGERRELQLARMSGIRGPRAGYTWFDATHLLGHVAGAGDGGRMGVGAGHGAEAGRPHHVRRDPYRGLYAGRDLSVTDDGRSVPGHVRGRTIR